mmetsp:Transcript_3593/g.10133  ORF Transcript_3593/g.10133 Transcript_3593/m.10133 type:complete len:211 (-) Transcript_3593:638-1270(-)
MARQGRLLCDDQPQGGSPVRPHPPAEQGKFAATLQQGQGRTPGGVFPSQQALPVCRQSTTRAHLPPGETGHGQAAHLRVPLDFVARHSSERRPPDRRKSGPKDGVVRSGPLPHTLQDAQVPRARRSGRGIPPPISVDGECVRRRGRSRLPQHGVLGSDAKPAHRSGEDPPGTRDQEQARSFDPVVPPHPAMDIHGGCRRKHLLVPRYLMM